MYIACVHNYFSKKNISKFSIHEMLTEAKHWMFFKLNRLSLKMNISKMFRAWNRERFHCTRNADFPGS